MNQQKIPNTRYFNALVTKNNSVTVRPLGSPLDTFYHTLYTFRDRVDKRLRVLSNSINTNK